MQTVAERPPAANVAVSTRAEPSLAELVRLFHESHPDSFHDQRTVAAVIGCSLEKLERDRWAGKGLPYKKFGRLVRYQKRAVLA